ncbi:MAG TPA: molybdopterin-dependent oxidoreductase [Bryobacteraceae bacterium]|nr:molybdopterin-dependent oxidoreductase [Bryobacteraceae bacterium]
MTLSRRQLVRMCAAGLIPASYVRAAEVTKKNMIVRSVRPQDLEMPLDGFSDFITPVERFFVRTHDYTPNVDLNSWKLSVEGEVHSPLTLAMDDLKRLPRVELVGVLECAGNGRSHYQPHVPGTQWSFGSVGNGRWAGARLADVLRRAGLKDSARQILFDGVDVPVGKMPDFQRTITVKKALDANTLLAFEMNGQRLPVQHGFPLRLIVPGWAGDSWVKWVQTIRVLDRDFDGFWMKTGYRRPEQPVAPGSAVDPAKMRPVTSLKVKSVIATPLDGAGALAGQPLTISGAAWSGDSGPVSAVEVSVDGGRSWRAAGLPGEHSQYGWRLWRYRWTPPAEGYYNVMARAYNSARETQPLVEEWNPSGYQWNVVQRVGVNVTPAAPSLQPAVAQADGPIDDYPAGYQAACHACHGQDMIRQQRLTRAQWEREVNKMAGWGAQVKPEERTGILKYLAGHFTQDWH